MPASICSSTLTLTGEVKKMSEWNKLSCDVLIIGGGIGGLSCATAIKVVPDYASEHLLQHFDAYR